MHSLEFIDLRTHNTPNSSIIWLHGLGADNHDFENLVTELNLPEQSAIRFILPNAPIQPVSINGGYPMRSWFDILGLDANSPQDELGIRKSQESINHLIDQMIASGINSERIILGGFSQGGALALYTAIRYPKKLGGVIGLSAYLPLADRASDEHNQVNSQMPVFLAHGTEDFIVPFQFGQISYNVLQGLGYPISWHQYPIPHSVSGEEIKDISSWIQKKLAL